MATIPLLYLNIGELIVNRDPSVISTVLGSCVSVCLFSPLHKMGGMIHYALPKAPADIHSEESFRYGDLAIPGLISEMRALTGEDPRRWQAKVTGGAAETNGRPSSFQAGLYNIELAYEILASAGIPVTGEDVGGSAGRKVLFHTHTGRLQVSDMSRREVRNQAPVPKVQMSAPALENCDLRTILAIGSSTGGTEALKKMMSALPEKIPPTVIAQHIPPEFSKAFANRLNEMCPFEVKEAEDGDELRVSRVLIAPGGKQMKVRQNTRGFFVSVNDDAPVNRHKPSVDYLFRSVAQIFGSKAVGVILTGMGADGAEGLLQMRSKGARTIAQDEESCVVYGMPRVAHQMGAAEVVAPLSDIPRLIMRSLEKKKSS